MVRQKHLIARYHTLFQQLQSDQPPKVIVATKRLTKTLQSAYCHWLIQQGSSGVFWGKSLVSVDDWIDQLWREYCFKQDQVPKVIESNEATLLLAQIIFTKAGRQSNWTNTLQQSRLVFQAWQQLQQWLCDVSVCCQDLDNQNVQAFYQWASAFEACLNSWNWLVDCQRVKYLTQHPADVIHQPIVLVGFDILTPDLETLLTSARHPYKLFMPETETYQQINCYAYETPHNEAYAIATEIQKQSYQNPEIQIGVVVPDLDQSFDTLQSIFDTVLLPDSERHLPILENRYRPYQISAGQPLIKQPVIAHLFQWLKSSWQTEFNAIAGLIQSPYIAYAKEYQSIRQLAISACKSSCQVHSSFKTILKQLAFAQQIDSSLLSMANNIEKNIPYHKKQLSFDQFSKIVWNIIELLKWPGTMLLTSYEHQAVTSFYKAWKQIKKCQRLAIDLTYHQWLAYCEMLLSQQPFQTENKADAPIQILGILESTGLYFDQMYLMHFDDHCWPKLVQPNPYLPYSVQKAYQMPHATPERELTFARQVTHRLLCQANKVTVSYCYYQNQSLSPLVSQITSPAIGSLHPPQPTAIVHYERQDVIRPVDTSLTTRMGGVTFLQDILTCPYRAHLKHRLNLEKLPEHQVPLDGAEKGQIIHDVLEAIWKTLNNQYNLKQITCIKKWVEAFIEHQLRQQGLFDTLPKWLVQGEQWRLQELITKWLELEQLRQMDFQVIQLEQTVMIKLGAFRLKGRIDRVDLLEDGQKIVIDYKTGQKLPASHAWDPASLKMPQLPVYALHQQADGIAIGGVNPKLLNKGIKQCWKVLSADGPWLTSTYPKPYEGSSDWPETFNGLKYAWKNLIDTAADAFAQGDLMPNPSTDHCRHCTVNLICRYQVA